MRKLLQAVSFLLLTVPMAFADGSLKVHADPGRTGVFLDGKYLGPAANFGFARTYKVPAGKHELKLDDPRYETVTKSIDVADGKTTTVSENMKALPAPKPPYGHIKIDCKCDKFTAVYVNDKFMGHVDEFDNFAQSLMLPVGDYTVKVVPPTGAPHEEKVSLKANVDTFVIVK